MLTVNEVFVQTKPKHKSNNLKGLVSILLRVSQQSCKTLYKLQGALVCEQITNLFNLQPLFNPQTILNGDLQGMMIIAHP